MPFLEILKARFRKLYLYRHTLWDMAVKQLKTKYSGSKLGIWWTIATPLILAASINFIFNKIFKIDIPNYTLLVLSGILPWMFFSNAILEATNSFTANVGILKQAIFPREFIPLSGILANLLDFFIGFSIILPLFLILNLKVITVVLFLFLPLILLFIFIIGLGLIFSVCNVFSKDLPHFLSIGLMIWFWITPVFYSIDMLSFPYRWICLANPLTYYIISCQAILFGAKIPPLGIMAVSVFISLFFLIAGFIFFIKKESQLLKRI